MEIDKYNMVGKDVYMELFKSAHDAIDLYFRSIVLKSKDQCFKSIDEIRQFPLVVIQNDFDNYVLQLTKSLVTEPNYIVQKLGANTIKLIKIVISDWFRSCFSSDIELQTALLCVYQLMSEVPQVRTAAPVTQQVRR